MLRGFFLFLVEGLSELYGEEGSGWDAGPVSQCDMQKLS